MSREEMVTELLSLARKVNLIVRGTEELQPREEAHRKLCTTDSAKPGELLELIHVLERKGERWEIADELADILYYGCQIGANVWFPRLETVVNLLGFTVEETLQCGLIKYGQRVSTGKKDKQAEGVLVRRYVEKIQQRKTDNQAAIEELRRILKEEQ
ncbi:MAG: hypothetical protein Q7R54_01185 [bacterium]|nr:hypothetical protein [bacterium]